jgi:methionyl-tRNA synthetase
MGALLEDQDTKLVHLLGKTHRFFHCDFPGDVKAAGSYILPDNVPANEFLNLEGNNYRHLKNWAVLRMNI